MEGKRPPTEFGWWLLHRMAEHEPRLSQIDLARLVGVGQATVSRWIYQEGIRPDTDALARLADALGVSRSEVLHRAGHGTVRPVAIDPEPVDPLLIELRRALDPSSNLTPDERNNIYNGVKAILTAYAPALRRTKRPAPPSRAAG